MGILALNKVDSALRYIVEGGEIIMKSKIIRLFVTLATSICTLMALSVSASACTWCAYQPEEPKCLKNKA